MKKSMPKTCCFSTSIFSGFGFDFGGSWASKMEPSWLLKPPKIVGEQLFDDLKLDVFTKWRLGGLRARFWRPRASILEGPGLIFEGFGRHIWNHERQERPKTCKNKSSITRWPDRQRVGGRRWSPPWGFNPPPTVGVRSVLNHNHIVLNQSSRPSTEGQALDVRLKFFVRLLDPYLFLSPGGGGPPPTWRQEAEFCRLVPFFLDFLLFQVAI